jgi:hypothetical protein
VAKAIQVHVARQAELFLITGEGERVVPTDEHMAQLGYVDRGRAYHRFVEQFERALGVTMPDSGPFAIIRYMAECAIYQEYDFDICADEEDTERVRQMVTEMRRAYQMLTGQPMLPPAQHT